VFRQPNFGQNFLNLAEWSVFQLCDATQKNLAFFGCE
jgi:hypothetical protein